MKSISSVLFFTLLSIQVTYSDHHKHVEDNSDNYRINYEIQDNVLFIICSASDHKLARQKSREMMSELFISNGIMSESGWDEGNQPQIVAEKGEWKTKNGKSNFENKVLVRFKDFKNENIKFENFEKKKTSLKSQKTNTLQKYKYGYSGFKATFIIIGVPILMITTLYIFDVLLSTS